MSELNKIRHQSFDGIQEYDNDLPAWWVWLFIITVVFAAIYPFVYDFGPGEFASETVDREVKLYQLERAAAVSTQSSGEETLLSLATNPQALNTGKDIFATRCLACHGDKGQGLIGPNLTDDHWIHGGSLKDIQKTVREGVLSKGMIAWKDQLTPEQIDAVVAFVWSLHGSNPPNAKAAEGEKVVRQ